jgi:hypothetical protein
MQGFMFPLPIPYHGVALTYGQQQRNVPCLLSKVKKVKVRL